MSVSYTHLDVYKRQVVIQRRAHKDIGLAHLDRLARIGHVDKAAFQVLGKKCVFVLADVYKRQP